ncbi:unnamed protein product [Cunninghamella echinulata]
MSTVQRRKPQQKETEKDEDIKKNETIDNKIPSLGNIVQTILIILGWGLLFFFLGSYLLTETWTWGYRGKWTNIHTYIPHSERVFTEIELSKYDGSNAIFLYIGDVFDVSQGSGWYGLGGSYSHFAGKDAARAYVTGCFQDHLTHDLRGLTETQLKGVAHWKSFYANHHKYHKVGTVIHPPIDDSTPIPKPCKQAVGQKP